METPLKNIANQTTQTQLSKIERHSGVILPPTTHENVKELIKTYKEKTGGRDFVKDMHNFSKKENGYNVIPIDKVRESLASFLKVNKNSLGEIESGHLSSKNKDSAFFIVKGEGRCLGFSVESEPVTLCIDSGKVAYESVYRVKLPINAREGQKVEWFNLSSHKQTKDF